MATTALHALPPDALLERLAASGLPGRGGGWFAAARKWRAVRAEGGESVVIANGAEGEPGSFKDRLGPAAPAAGRGRRARPGRTRSRGTRGDRLPQAIPSEFSTPEREAAKKNLIESLRGLAKAGSDDEIKALWEKARDSMGTMGRP